MSHALKNAALAVLGVAVVVGAAATLGLAGDPPKVIPSSAVVAAGASPTAQPRLFQRGADGSARVMFIGDSLTGGYFASTADAGFRSVVVARLGESGPVNVAEASRAHATLTTVSSFTKVPAGLDLAVVELGTNDVTQQTPIDRFDATYRALLGRIATTSPTAALVCIGAWNSASESYDAKIKQECLDHGGTFIPVDDLFGDPEMHAVKGTGTFAGSADDFHPNDRGHLQIARRILAAIGY